MRPARAVLGSGGGGDRKHLAGKSPRDNDARRHPGYSSDACRRADRRDDPLLDGEMNWATTRAVGTVLRIAIRP